MADEQKGARSYKGQIFGDSMAITINFKWLLQIIAATAMVVYAWYQLESRIQKLERNMDIAMDEIELHDQERKEAEAKHIADMQQQMEWYESELNLNPFSWGKKKN